MLAYFHTLYSLRLLTLVLWCGVIYFFSDRPGSGIPYDPPLWYVLERKGAHVFEYAVLTFLAWRYFHGIFLRETCIRVLLLSGSFSLMYGILDELHQFFIFGRGARFTDVAVDLIGISLVLGFLAFHRRGQ